MREILQRLTGKPFVKIRPAFLRNPKTNRCLELDAYNEELRLGVEFQGIQHYTFPNPFHSTRAQFEKQLQRDILKATLCEAHEVRLVAVPHHVQRDELEHYLQIQLHAVGFNLCNSMHSETEEEALLSFGAIDLGDDKCL